MCSSDLTFREGCSHSDHTPLSPGRTRGGQVSRLGGLRVQQIDRQSLRLDGTKPRELSSADGLWWDVCVCAVCVCVCVTENPMSTEDRERTAVPQVKTHLLASPRSFWSRVNYAVIQPPLLPLSISWWAQLMNDRRLMSMNGDGSIMRTQGTSCSRFHCKPQEGGLRQTDFIKLRIPIS